MPDLKKTRNHLVVIAGAMIVLDVLAGILLMTPYAGRESLRQEQLRQLWAGLKAREMAPWRGLDKKIPEAKKEVAAFYQDRFPTGYSAISADIDRIAFESGARISSKKYKQDPAAVDNLQQVEIDAEVSGDYLQLVKFINTVERNKLFFVITSLELGGEQTGIVKLKMKLETFLRTT